MTGMTSGRNKVWYCPPTTVLPAGLLPGTEIAHHHRHDYHRAKNYPHRCAWVPKVHVQAQGRKRDDSVIKHVASERKGPARHEPVASSQRRSPSCHRVQSKGDHNEREGARPCSAERGNATGHCNLYRRAETG